LAKQFQSVIFEPLISMDLRAFISISYFFFLSTASGNCQQLQRELFYAAMQADNLVLVSNELQEMQKKNENEPAFKGALLMKKAGLVKDPIEKMKLFKEGRILLEKEISNNAANVEFRFMRLMIQEHVPPITHYQKNIKEDAAFIGKHFDELPVYLRKTILRYRQKSAALQQQTLNETVHE
jgi:hypothetical protein